MFYGDPRLVIRIEDASHAPPCTPTPTPDSPFALAPVEPPPPPVVAPDPGVVGPDAVTAALAGLATQYEQVIAIEPASTERTLKLEGIVQQVGAEASGMSAPALADLLASAADGDRLVGVVAARGAPHPELAAPLLAVLGTPRTNFEEYQVLKTLLTVVDSFEETQRVTVREAVLAKLEDDEFLGSDRAILARDVLTKVPAPAIPGN